MRHYSQEEITALLELDRQRSQGTVVRHVSGEEYCTDLEYRGEEGKWTLATVTENDNNANAAYLAVLWNDACAIIRQLSGVP